MNAQTFCVEFHLLKAVPPPSRKKERDYYPIRLFKWLLPLILSLLVIVVDSLKIDTDKIRTFHQIPTVFEWVPISVVVYCRWMYVEKCADLLYADERRILLFRKRMLQCLLRKLKISSRYIAQLNLLNGVRFYSVRSFFRFIQYTLCSIFYRINSSKSKQRDEYSFFLCVCDTCTSINISNSLNWHTANAPDYSHYFNRFIGKL